MAKSFLFTYAPHALDLPLFTSDVGTGETLYDKLLGVLRQHTLYFVGAKEHPTTNTHWHFAGTLNEESSKHGKDWLPRLLKPYFPKVKSTVKATKCDWVTESEILKSMAYCQKEHGNDIVYYNITEEQKRLMDAINASVPERDLVTYNIIKSKDKFCCAVMRECEENRQLREQIWRVLINFGGFHNSRTDELTAGLIRNIAQYNILFSGRWDTVITTLLQQFTFRGWMSPITTQEL